MPRRRRSGNGRRLEREQLRDVGDALDDRLRRDPLLLVVRELGLAAAVRLLEGALDRLGQLVRVHQDGAVHVPRRAADRLQERGLAAEEPFLVGVEDRDERHLRQVEPFAKQVDADEHVVLAEPQLADDLDALERVDLGVEIARLDARLEQVVGEVLGHLLRQRRDEDALVRLLAAADLAEQVVDLVLRRPELDLGVDDPGRADQLLRDDLRVTELVRARRRRDEHHLTHLAEELVEAERAVVERGREPEAVVDERLLPRAVALVHPADLRHRLVRLVDEDDEVLGEVVDQRERVRPGRAALEDARVVLDPAREAELLQHLHVVLRALPDPVGLEHPPLGLEPRDLLLELVADLVDRALDRRLRRDVLRRRPDREVVELREHLARERVEVRDLLDLVAEHRDPVRGLRVRRLHLDDVAAHPEAAAREHRVVPDVLRVDQRPEQLVAVVLGADLEDQDALAPLLGRAEAVDARHAGDDHHVAPREERARRAEPQARDVVVLRGVLLDVEIGLRDVRLGLVVVVVGDEVLDGVLGEELPELVAELRGERLVVGDHERRALELLHDPGHRRRLPGPGRTEERLSAVPGAKRLGELRDRLRLVAGRAVGGGHAELGHSVERSNGPNACSARRR